MRLREPSRIRLCEVTSARCTVRLMRAYAEQTPYDPRRRYFSWWETRTGPGV
jgi:hypothetical protein